MENLEIANKPPAALADETRRDLPGDPLDIQVRTESLKNVRHEIQILVQAELFEALGMLGELLFHGRAFHDLELMELHTVQRQLGNHAAGCKHHFASLARQSEYEMGTGPQSPCRRGLNRPAGTVEIVSTVDVFQHGVVAGLDAELELDDMALRLKLSEIIQLLVIYTVRSCSDDQTYDIRVRKRFRIQLAKARNWSVCIRVCLKIRKVMGGIPVTDAMEFNALVDLLRKRLSRGAVSRVKRCIVTVGTASHAYRTVPVRTAETGIQNELLEPFTIDALVIADGGVVSFSIWKFHVPKVNIFPIFVDMKKTAVSIAAFLLAALSLSAQTRWAVTNLAVNFMREAPDYAAELGDQALMGTVVKIVDEDSYWRQIISPEPYTAWVNEMGLVEMTEEEKDEYIMAEKYIVTSDYSTIREKPTMRSRQISDLVMGCLVRELYDEKDRPSHKGSWVEVMLPSGETGWTPRKDVENYAKWLDTRKLNAKNVLAVAERLHGTAYMWGGTSIKGVDCSGLARTCYFMNGVLLPRNASQQVNVGMAVEPIARRLEPGDLLFFGTPASGDRRERITHVGIYMGDGMYIHSSQQVRISSIDPDSPDYAGRSPLRACRVIGHVDTGEGIVSMYRSPFYFGE